MSKKSFLSRIAEFILWKTKPDYMTSQEEVELFLDGKSDEDFMSLSDTSEFEGMKVVSFGKNYDDLRVILFIHGGAYVNQLNFQHQLYCFLLSKMLKIRVVLPAYPLAPKHECIESYELIAGLYSSLVDKYDNVTLMGDSAGGGLALGLCEYLNEIKVKQPDNIIVFSPWLDISMKRLVDDSNDPILGNAGLKKIGKVWAGKLSTADYRVSPLYSNYIDFPRTLIFAGTNEIFYDDIREYYEKLAYKGVNVELIVGNDLFHIYPLFPIPEAIGVLKKIKKEMK